MNRMQHVGPVLVLALVGVLGCAQDPVIVNPPTFERPGDVAFVCFDREGHQYVDMSECSGQSNTLDDRFAMTALVTQTASGEVAAVDLRLDRTLDADVRVPGFTFVRVGEIPSGIIVPVNEPGVTYVANYGSRTLQWIETARFRPDVEVLAGVDEGAVALPDGPTDLVISEDGETLFVALPRLGAVLPVSILPSRVLETPSMDELVFVGLDPTPAPLAMGVPTEYRRFCGYENPRRPFGAPRPALALGDSAAPEELLVVGDVLLVADSSLPVIYRFQIEAGGALTPLSDLATGRPVRKMVVSPEVPAALDGMSGSARYLYAIDATDQSVMVLDYLEGSPTFGALLPVHTSDGLDGARGDRIRLPADARSLGILTPGFPGALCSDVGVQARPTQLRGVFLTVGMTNGNFMVVDIVDLDAPCRGGLECTSPGISTDVRTAMERHRPRVGDLVREPLQVGGIPSFSFRGTPGQLGEDGSGPDPGEPRLVPQVSCPPFMTAIWGGMEETGENRDMNVICAIDDPWATGNQRWRATYEGPIPGTTGGRGRFDGGLERISASDAAFCRRGVLGSEDVAASGLGANEPEAGYAGDRVRIVSDPAPSRVEANSACAQFVDPGDGRRRPIQVEFRILSVRDQVLAVAREPGVDYRFVEECYGGALFRYEVRARKAFVVQGGRPLQHRVVNVDDTCRVDVVGQPIDPNDPLTFRGIRARSGRPFVSSQVAFQIGSAEDLGILTAELGFNVINSPRSLLVDVGGRGAQGRRPALVEQLIYNPVNERLYALDGNSDGFVEYSLDPLTVDHIFE